MAEKQLKSIKFQGLNTTYVIPEVDPTSTVSGDAADAKVVGDHINNQNNPHDVTIEQIGAAPAGFGLGEDSIWLSDDIDIDSIVKCGWYSYGASNISVNKPYNIGNIFVLARGTTGTCTQLATSRNNSAVFMKVRVMYDNGIWSAWEEFSPSSFAPATHNHAASEITSGTLAVARGGTGGTSALAARKQLGTANSYNIGSNDTASQYDGVYYGWVQTNHYATPNTTNNYGDAYYTIVDSNGIFHIGLQLNQATSINWYKQYGENNVIYSSTQPSGSKGMIWLKPV